MPFVITRRKLLNTGICVGGTAVAFRPFKGFASQKSMRPRLPIPPQVEKDLSGSVNLNVNRGFTRFGNRPHTPTYGVNGTFLGPAVKVQRGEKVNMQVHNNLHEPITMHWHGLIVPGEVDGGPHQIVSPGQSWTASLEIDQPAATLWFHPHMYPTTAEMVTKGVAGLLLVEDEESKSMNLPSEWGVDDVPLVIQDRRFNEDGSFFHKFNLPAVTVGYVGDAALVNGAEYPIAKTARGWVRFRILNGSNARGYKLRVSDKRKFFVIGTDGGLLSQPVALRELLIHTGERYEVLVDARDGKNFDFVTLPTDQPIMNLPPFDQPLPLVTIDPSGKDGGGRLPDKLVAIPALPHSLPDVSQKLTMDMFRDDAGMKQLMSAGLAEVTKGSADYSTYTKLSELIVDSPALSKTEQLSSNGVNGSSYSLEAKPFEVSKGRLLRWRIEEGSDTMMHPVHVHGCQFRITSLNGSHPPEHLAGWKDTVAVEKSSYAEILVKFSKSAGPDKPYMVHCHNLEHEDSGMMAQFTVV